MDTGKAIQGAALRLDLKPGTYLLFCNIPGHFTSGMWTIFTVK
nr:sulfocyanin-like copper-binding protein [Mesorhizobium sp. M00.F.Ca.ET.216.01.1.1]